MEIQKERRLFISSLYEVHKVNTHLEGHICQSSHLISQTTQQILMKSDIGSTLKIDKLISLRLVSITQLT